MCGCGQLRDSILGDQEFTKSYIFIMFSQTGLSSKGWGNQSSNSDECFVFVLDSSGFQDLQAFASSQWFLGIYVILFELFDLDSFEFKHHLSVRTLLQCLLQQTKTKRFYLNIKSLRQSILQNLC